jgi:hypothetical protein
VNDRAHALIAAVALKLAGKEHTQEQLYDELFTLVRLCYLPERQAVVPVRRMPAAGEVLPPQQRATWARARTPYDAPDAEIPRRHR